MITINEVTLLLSKIINLSDEYLLEHVKKNIVFKNGEFKFKNNFNMTKILKNKHLQTIKIILVEKTMGSQSIVDGGINLEECVPNFVSKNKSIYKCNNITLFTAINKTVNLTKNFNDEWSKTCHRVCETITYWDWSNCSDFCRESRNKNKYYNNNKKYYGKGSRICLCGAVTKKFTFGYNYFLSDQSGSRCGFQNALGRLLGNTNGQIDMCDLEEVVIWGNKNGCNKKWNPLLPCGVCYENMRTIVEHQYIPLNIYCYLPNQKQNDIVKEIIKIPFESLHLFKYYANIMTKDDLINMIRNNQQ